MWNQNLPGAPVVNFHKFFDGENITQEDLVAWVNVGTHHLPQSEDSPNTRTNLAASRCAFHLSSFCVGLTAAAQLLHHATQLL